MEAVSDPHVSFNAKTGVTADLSYRMSIFVDNATLGVPHIATLAVNLTIIGAVEVSYHGDIVLNICSIAGL